MPRFEVQSRGIVVGYSELGLAAREASQEHLSLVVRLSGGLAMPAQGGIRIIDYTAEIGSEGLS